jgi:hypothetical protein
MWGRGGRLKTTRMEWKRRNWHRKWKTPTQTMTWWMSSKSHIWCRRCLIGGPCRWWSSRTTAFTLTNGSLTLSEICKKRLRSAVRCTARTIWQSRRRISLRQLLAITLRRNITTMFRLAIRCSHLPGIAISSNQTCVWSWSTKHE